MSLRSFFGRRSDDFESFNPLSLELWDPFHGLDVFDQRRRRLAFPAGETSTFAGGARIDWRETPTAHVFEADLPGVKKEEMKVEIEDGKVLQISGERRREVEEVGDAWHRVERSSGTFMRRFQLPEDAMVDHVKAAMENGVLTVTVPKDDAKKKKADVKSVEIHG